MGKDLSAATTGKVVAIVLAAGSSSRMGQPKQLLEWEGKTLIRHILSKVSAACISDIIVVWGANATKIKKELDGLSLNLVYNEDWQEGLGSSVVAGTRESIQLDPQALLFVLVDQPYVSVQLLQQIIEQHIQNPDAVIVSDYGPHPGVPALFPAFFFPGLLELSGDAGARKIIKQYTGKVCLVPFPEGKYDLDTPEDWQAFLS